MASHSSSLLLILAFACFVSQFSPAISQTCSTQNVLLAGRTPFENCLDLPHLDSFLHYTYNASNSSLSVAFVATPSGSDGWVSWAINPTGTKMSGSQAFLAYRSGAGVAPVVKTYNISGVTLNEGRLSFEYWNLRAESLSNGRIAIRTSVKVPSGATRVNQLWQLGGNVTGGVPRGHPFAPANMNSLGVLSLTASATSPAPGSSPAPTTPGSSPAPTTPGQAGRPGNAGSLTTGVNFGVNLGILVLLGSIFVF